MASQPSSPSHSDQKPPMKKAAPITYSEQLALRKHEMALECAEIQHLQAIATLQIHQRRAEATLRIEMELEQEREAKKKRERRRQEERDNKDTVDSVVEFFTYLVLIFLVAAVVMGPLDALQRVACLLGF
ncbi:hypothetical protein VE00_10956 [Pseudogymnoascus sp. WSF 3629]|nr:hypothetical protein VE00_10956 [Pseudogymnoascus sp. WSF 3629]